MADLKEVKQLRETKSKHDIQYKGKTFHLKIDPCDHGVVVEYYEKIPLEKLLPGPLRHMVQDSGKTQDIPVVTHHVHLKWWEKLFGMKLEKKAMKRVQKIKNRFNAIKENEQRANEVSKWLES